MQNSILATKSKNRKPSFFTSILSVAFVLFLLGVFTLLVVQTNKVFTHLKENLEVNVFLEDFAEEEAINALQDEFSLKPYIKSVEYISKEQAKEDFAEEFEMTILEENPLPASLNLNLYANYTNTDSLKIITEELGGYDAVGEIIYQDDLVNLLNTNIKKIGAILLGASILFIIIAFTLIDSTIRLSVFSKRFLIKSMQLVGAKNSFIVRPFVRKAVLNGLVSSFIALAMLFAVTYLLSKNYNLFSIQDDLQFFVSIAIGIIILGVFISYLATWLSVRKYLKAKIEDLY